MRTEDGGEGHSAPGRLFASAVESRHDDRARVARLRRFDASQRLELMSSRGEGLRVPDACGVRVAFEPKREGRS